MSLLKDLEGKLEKVFEGLFAKGFKAGIQPIEIAKNLAKHMDSHKTISVNQVYVPNQFTIFLNVEDFDRIKPFKSAFIPELQDFLTSHARKEGYTLLSVPMIEMFAGEDLKIGQMALEATTAPAEETMAPVVEAAGSSPPVAPAPEATSQPTAPSTSAQPEVSPPSAPTVETAAGPLAYLISSNGKDTYPLTKPAVVIGRLKTNEIVVRNSSVSRVHATIIQSQDGFILKDLESTNGTFVNGKKITEQALKDGDQITLGTANLLFKVGNVG